MDSLQEIWRHVLNAVFDNPNISQASYNLWFRELELIRLTDTTAFIGTGKDFKAQILETRYKTILSKELCELIGFDVNLVFISLEDNTKTPDEIVDDYINGIEKVDPDPNPDLYPSEPEENTAELSQEAIVNRPKNKQDYTFDNFIAGNTNDFARNACMAVAQNPANMFNPLFIYGAPGLGKTHLLYAIYNYLLKNQNNLNLPLYHYLKL